MSTFHVVTVVWGRPYLDLFLDVAVPNQLTPGNLAALPAGSRYRVVTSPEDAKSLATSPILDRVNQLMPVDLVAIPELSDSSNGPFAGLSAGHRRALQDAAGSAAALIFLNADHFMSEGALAAVVRRHAAGSRAVASTSIRLSKETFVPHLRARASAHGISSRELVSLACGHLHPSTLAHLTDGAPTARWPIGVYWKIPQGEGILARAFYLHPLMVDPVDRGVLPKKNATIDAKYLMGACPVREQIHVVTDSDELCLFELSFLDGVVTDTCPRGMSLWRAARMLSRCDAYQQSYWRTAIRLHARDLGPAWSSVEDDAARFAARAMWLQPAARSLYLISRRLKPMRRRAGALRKGFRCTTKDLTAIRLQRSIMRAARPILKIPDRASRLGRYELRRIRRSLVLLSHSAARPVGRLRKRVARASRRVLRRVRMAH